MNENLLADLQEIHAFDPTARYEELGYLHVPFDELHSTAVVEQRISEAVCRGERVALIGTSGNGKSSTASYVAGPLSESIMSFRIGVTVEDPSILLNPGRFAQHVVQHIAQKAMEVPALQRDQMRLMVAETQTVRREQWRRTGANLNAKLIGLSRDLGHVEQLITRQTSSREYIEALDHALEVVRSSGASPVLVIDDSDTWLELENAKLGETRQAFFGPIMRMLAERNCGLIVAVDERYLESADYQPARNGFLPTEVHIPRLRDAVDLERIFSRRIEQIEGAVVGEVFTDSVLEDIYSDYESSNRSLRQTMRLAHSSLFHVSTLGESRIGPAAFATSVREFVTEFR